MNVISTPEQESIGLVNSMQVIRRTKCNLGDTYDMGNMTLAKIRNTMQENSDAQKYYVSILCDALDNYVACNDIMQV